MVGGLEGNAFTLVSFASLLSATPGLSVFFMDFREATEFRRRHQDPALGKGRERSLDFSVEHTAATCPRPIQHRALLTSPKRPAAPFA